MFTKKLTGVMVLLGLLLITTPLAAAKKIEAKNEVVSEARQKILSQISVEGDYFTPKHRIFDVLDLEEGQPYSLGDIRNAQGALMALGIYSQVEYRIEPSPKGDRVVFIINERPLVGEVKFKGSSVYTETQLNANVKAKPNTVEDFSSLKEDISSLNALYQKDGYIDCKVVQVDHPEKDGDPLTYVVSERLLTEVRITGNAITKPYVIKREMVSKLGTPMRADTLKEDLRRIYNLGYFGSVVPKFIQGQTPTSQILELAITEKRNGTFTFGGGYGAISGLSLFTNFSWENFLGMGQSIAFNGEFGRSSTYRFKYYNPWMWDERKSFSYEIWSRNGGVDSFNPLSGSSGLTFRNEISRGMTFGFGFPGSYQLRTQHNFKFESVELVDKGLRYSIQSYNFIVSNDTRDYWMNPKTGGYQSLSIDKAFTMLGSSIDYTKFDLEIRGFNQLVENQVLATRAMFGYMISPEINNADKFAREYYRVGGANTVRGYDDFAPFAYGDQQIVLNMEYRFLLNEGFQWLLFADAGNASTSVDDADRSKVQGVSLINPARFRIGKGVGVRLTVPMLGSIRLDFGINDKGDQRIHFNIGNTF